MRVTHGLARHMPCWSPYVRFCAPATILLLAGRGSAATFTFQEGQNGYVGCVDTFLAQALPSTAHGELPSWEWDSDDPPGTGEATIGLIRFDNIFGSLPGHIPPGSQITSATLSYTVWSEGNPGSLREALVDWSESVTYDTFGGTPGVQADERSELLGTAGGLAMTHQVDVTCSLIRWTADPESNHGWMILATGGDGVDVWSSEYVIVPNIVAERPKLTVVIDEGAPSATLTRQPYLQRGTPTSITVVWRTSLCTDSRIRFGPAPDHLDREVTDGALAMDHLMTVTDLTPGTRYYYEVGSTSQSLAGADANHYFDTSPAPGAAVAFTAWIVGDSGVGGGPQFAVRDAMLARTAGRPPNLYLHVGDMAYDYGRDVEFTNNFFTPYAEILRRTVCWPTLGNHEGESSSSVTQTGPYYEGYVLPTGGEAGGVASGTEAYYSFDHANVHFICLDSHDSDRSPGSAMLEWLSEDLAATDPDWLIAFWHHPPYSKGTHDSDDIDDSGGRMRDMRENVLPMLEAAGVDLVLTGHSHIYERSFLVDGAYDTPTTAAGHILDPGDGRTYGDGAYLKPAGSEANLGSVHIVAGHGGQTLGGAGNHPLMYFSEVAHGSCLLTVNGNVLSVRNVRSDGEVSDHFAIVKGVATGDYNGDGRVALSEFVPFLECFSGPAAVSVPTRGPATELRCLTAFDADRDGDIDLADYGAFTAVAVRWAWPPRRPSATPDFE